MWSITQIPNLLLRWNSGKYKILLNLLRFKDEGSCKNDRDQRSCETLENLFLFETDKYELLEFDWYMTT